MGKLLVGTSGWSYNDWRGRFYPPGTRVEDYLSVYSRTFATVEINNSFYRLPPPEIFQKWARHTPPDFVFAVKASRYITHVKKLSNVEAPLNRFLDSAVALEDKLGPILFQFPANWKANPERLAAFLEILPSGIRFAFEFRHRSWFQPRIFEMLSAHGASFCHIYSDRWPSSTAVTAGFVFIRLHGHYPTYASSYSQSELAQLAKTISKHLDAGLDTYVYFNNDINAYAVRNACDLLHLLEGRPPLSSSA
jgi:uncharacterized protein YecE (DUF72 family)